MPLQFLWYPREVNSGKFVVKLLLWLVLSPLTFDSDKTWRQLYVTKPLGLAQPYSAFLITRDLSELATKRSIWTSTSRCHLSDMANCKGRNLAERLWLSSIRKLFKWVGAVPELCDQQGSGGVGGLQQKPLSAHECWALDSTDLMGPTCIAALLGGDAGTCWGCLSVFCCWYLFLCATLERCRQLCTAGDIYFLQPHQLWVMMRCILPHNINTIKCTAWPNLCQPMSVACSVANLMFLTTACNFAKLINEHASLPHHQQRQVNWNSKQLWPPANEYWCSSALLCWWHQGHNFVMAAPF